MKRALLLPALLLATPAFAQETRQSAAAKFNTEFNTSDLNHDGFLTRAEVAKRIASMKVGPGKPDPVHAKRLTDLWFAQADANHDGKVTRAEAQALLSQTFDRYEAARAAKGSGR